MLSNILNLFISKQESKEINKETIRVNGDKIIQTNKTSITYYSIPEDIKQDIINKYIKEI